MAAWAVLLKEGAESPRGEDETWATYMRPIPRTEPPVTPAGLWATPAEARERWEADGFRYPPCLYKSWRQAQAPVQPRKKCSKFPLCRPPEFSWEAFAGDPKARLRGPWRPGLDS